MSHNPSSPVLPFNGYTPPEEFLAKIDEEYPDAKAFIVGVIHKDGTYTWHWSNMPVGELACASILLNDRVTRVITKTPE